MIHDNKVGIILMQEVKMKKESFDKIANYMLQGEKYVYDEVVSASGGIATMWNPNRLDSREILCHLNFVAVGFTDEKIIWCS